MGLPPDAVLQPGIVGINHLAAGCHYSLCQNVYSDSLTGTHLERNGNQCHLLVAAHS